VALSRLAHAGVVPVTSEMVAFEWTGDAKAKTFKTDERHDPRSVRQYRNAPWAGTYCPPARSALSTGSRPAAALGRF
jgi:hypothetical protein